MIPGRRAGLALYALLLVGCETRQPEPQLEAIEPDRAYTDRDVRLQLKGAEFVPSFLVDPRSGHREAKTDGFSGRLLAGGIIFPLSDVTWVALDRLSAVLPQAEALRLSEGEYQVEITDPRGRTARLPGPGFTALGADRGTLTLDIESPAPDTYVAPGSRLAVHAVARRTAPGRVTELAWSYRGLGNETAQGQCPCGDTPQEVHCSFELTVGKNVSAVPPGAEVLFAFIAEDDAPMVPPVTSYRRLAVQKAPTIRQIRPSRGGIAGGTDVVVSGSDFAPDAQVLVDGVPLAAGGGVRIDAGLITGRMPPHAAGIATLTVRTGPGVVSAGIPFEYLAPPTLQSLSTSWGLAAQDTTVEIEGSNFTAQTQIFLGPSLSGAVLVESTPVSDSLIRALFPAGSPGSTTVWALDSDLGWSSLVNGFTWRAALP